MVWVLGGEFKKKKKKQFYFHKFLPPHFLIHLHSQEKKGQIQCLHAQIALVLQPARYEKKLTKKKNPVNLEKNVNTKHGTWCDFVQIMYSAVYLL